MFRAAIVPSSSRSAAARGRWRLTVLFAVLAGLFLMHGISSGDSCAALGSPPIAASQNAPMAVAGAPVGALTLPGPATVAAAEQCGCDGMGAVCVPLRHESAMALLAVLMAGVALALAETAGLLALAGIALGVGDPSMRRRTARAVPLRALVCVSRT
jgi:hypothetical protein